MQEYYGADCTEECYLDYYGSAFGTVVTRSSAADKPQNFTTTLLARASEEMEEVRRCSEKPYPRMANKRAYKIF